MSEPEPANRHRSGIMARILENKRTPTSFCIPVEITAERGAMPEKAFLSITVYGLVQGVLLRDFVRQHAIALDLRGYVRNLPQGRSVEIRAEGRRERLEKLMEHVKVGPRRAKIERIEANWAEYTGILPRFEIRY